MTATKHPFSEDLLDLDPTTAAADQSPGSEVRRLYERRLTASDWFWTVVMGLGGAIGASVCGLLAATEPETTPMLTRLILAGLALIGFFWAVLSATIIRRGVVNSAIHQAIAAKMGFTFSLVAVIVIGVASLAGAGGTPPAGLMLLPLATLILATVVVINHQIRQTELRLQQRLLEMEHRLVSIAEARLQETTQPQ